VSVRMHNITLPDAGFTELTGRNPVTLPEAKTIAREATCLITQKKIMAKEKAGRTLTMIRAKVYF
ncbi:TPA: hypothetical protein ACLF0M_001546, partial [Pseudomonas aeruginosa]